MTDNPPNVEKKRLIERDQYPTFGQLVGFGIMCVLVAFAIKMVVPW